MYASSSNSSNNNNNHNVTSSAPSSPTQGPQQHTSQRRGSFFMLSSSASSTALASIPQHHLPMSGSQSVPASPQRADNIAPVSPSSQPTLSRRLSLVGLALQFSSSSTSLSSMPSPSNSNANYQVSNTGLPSPTGSPSSESTPRGIADLFAIFKRDKAAPVWFGVSETEDMKRLDQVLLDRDRRNELIMQLFAAHSEWALGVRFISFFSEYLSTVDKKEKQMKGRKILGTFFQPGSMFLLKGIPEEDLGQVRMEHLGMVKTYLLSELVKVPLVADFVREAELLSAELAFRSSAFQTSSQMYHH